MFVDASIHWFIDSSSSRWLIASLIHWLIENRPTIHSFIHSFVVRSFIHFIPLAFFFCHFIFTFFMSFHFHFLFLFISCIQWFAESSIHWLHSLIHRLTNSLIHWFIGSLGHLCMDSLMSFHVYLNHHLLISWCTSQLQQAFVSTSQKLSYRPLISHSHFIFKNFRPGMGRALSGSDIIQYFMYIYIYYTNQVWSTINTIVSCYS